MERRGERIIAVRWVNGRGQKIFESKADACRQIGITMKKLDRCVEYEYPVIIDEERYYLDVLLESGVEE